jgi:cytosine deaminase
LRDQVVAFPQEGIVRDPGAAELLDEAMKEGCDIRRRPALVRIHGRRGARAYRHLFRYRQALRPDIHMLVDDTDDENSRSLEYLALKTMRENFHGRVAASHCGAMAVYNDVYAAKIVDLVATAGVTISVNATSILCVRRGSIASRAARHRAGEGASDPWRKCRHLAG